jgi:hypothetical protein
MKYFDEMVIEDLTISFALHFFKEIIREKEEILEYNEVDFEE